MTEQSKKDLKFGLMIIPLYAIGVAGIIFLVNFLSCVSKPEMIKGEPMACFQARQFVYYAKAGFNKDQLPESTTTDGVRTCFAKIRYEDCKKEREDFLLKYKYNPNIYDIANISLYNNAQANFKDCLINSSK